MKMNDDYKKVIDLLADLLHVKADGAPALDRDDWWHLFALHAKYVKKAYTDD